ncbi:MAG: putative immunity protein, partial [Candidatus Acidiferrales bacterium]
MRLEVAALTKGEAIFFAADCAERVLPIFERAYPTDNRPRKSIEAAHSDASVALARAAALAAHAAARVALADGQVAAA